MRLTMKERKAISKVVSGRYWRAKKREKSKIPDEFIEITGYNREVCGVCTEEGRQRSSDFEENSPREHNKG